MSPQGSYRGNRPHYKQSHVSHKPSQDSCKQSKETSLPPPRPIVYFWNGKMNTELMDEKAEETAQELREVSSTQLRRFYDDVLTLRQRLKAEQGQNPSADENEVFAELRADFKMLKAKAVYARGRNKNTFPMEFLQFFIDHVTAVKNARDFEAFCKHFQAVVAFHRFYGKKD